MPIRNEEAFLRVSLDSLLANDYPLEMLEVIVIDGMSSDSSREIIQEYSQRYPCIKYLQNPQKIVSTGLNLGIQVAEGYIIVRADAHTRYESDYIRQCVTLLESTGAANVGGAQRAVGTSLIGSAIAVATTSTFGTGDAKFRYSDQEAWVDTVYLGAWHRETLIALGGFAENLTVNQDYELNHRIRRQGGRILLSPKIRCHYYVRGSLNKLARQYFRYGLWKVNTLVLHPYSLKWRQIVAPLLLAFLVIAFLLAGVSKSVFWLGPVVVYLSATIIASGRALRSAPWRVALVLPFVFAVLHFSWGAGFWCGLLRFGVPGLNRSRPATQAQKFTSPVSYGR
jgi:cellulose synthase/poly-beta-1,6-N-acetylglucosamine synthase-like glycosyltransferase